MANTYDVFISYATEDRESVARPLVAELEKQWLRVWIDYKEVAPGDVLRDRINEGLRDARFGVVILSPDYLRKHWTQNELGALLDPDKQGRRLLFIRHRITPAELASQDPLLAGRLLTSTDQGLEPVVALITARTGRPGVQDHPSVAVDFSHQQAKWDGLAEIFSTPRFERITGSLVGEEDIVGRAAVLIIPMPFHCQLSRMECDVIEKRVSKGAGVLLLGYYGERHHEANLSELGWRFDLTFGDDLVLNADYQDHDTRAHVFSRDARLALRVPIDEAQSTHRIFKGVGELALQSCATVSPTAKLRLELQLVSPPSAAVLHPLGHIRPDGGRPVVEEWKLHEHRAAPVLTALRYGKGKVAAVGTWKLLTLDASDNRRLFENLLAWLSSPE